MSNLKKKIFYSHSSQTMSQWLEDNKDKIEIIGMTQRTPYMLKDKIATDIQEITIHYKEK